MGKNVKTYDDGCSIGQSTKKPKGKIPGLLTPLIFPHVPLFRLHSDIAEGVPVV
jgi:hypothetical protein